MTKKEIAQHVAQRLGLTQTDTAAVIEGLLEVVSSALEQGKSVEIRGWGTFKVVDRAPRTGRNPSLGEQVEIPKRRAPVWKPSAHVKDRVARAPLRGKP